jgi:ABC-2 type transport system ATP-binding protein
METVIEVENLVKVYKSVRAVDGISFQVQRGEIFGIVGPNGAGKTTTVECLSGLRRPDAGSVRILGLDPVVNERELRKHLGLQLQHAALPDDLKVIEALDLFAALYLNPLNTRQLIKEWGLAEKVKARFATLSGGQKQRLFIAIALVNNPELVVLDELTTGLDPQARHSTWELVERLRENGKTVVLVTHFMEEAERLCDRVAVVDHGKILALNTPAALVRNLGGGAQRVRFSAPIGLNWTTLERLPGVETVVRLNGEVIVTGCGVLSGVVKALDADGQVPDDLRTEQTTLEDVFLALTGRQMREITG